MTCIIRDMGECNCAPGQCISHSKRMELDESGRKKRDIARLAQAKKNSYRVMLVALTVASLCAFAGASWNTLKNMERSYQLQARI